MKYFILSIIMSLIFFSCSDEEENNDDYGNNHLFGAWDSYHAGTDSLVVRRVFTLNFYSYFSFAEGKSRDQYNKQKYRIEGNQIILDRYTQTFRIDKDTLWITNSMQDQVTKYIRNRWIIPGVTE